MWIIGIRSSEYNYSAVVCLFCSGLGFLGIFSGFFGLVFFWGGGCLLVWFFFSLQLLLHFWDSLENQDMEAPMEQHFKDSIRILSRRSTKRLGFLLFHSEFWPYFIPTSYSFDHLNSAHFYCEAAPSYACFLEPGCFQSTSQVTEAIKAFILMLLVKGLTTGQSSLQLTLTLEMLLDFQSIPQLSAAVNNRRNLFGQGDAGSPPVR